MKRAIKLRPYSDVKTFAAPDGVVSVTIDPQSGMPASPLCPQQKEDVFIAGTEPVGMCTLHGGRGDQLNVSGWDMPNPQNGAPKVPTPTPYVLPPRRTDQPNPAITSTAPPVGAPPQSQAPSDQPPPKKKGFFGRLKDVFK